MYVCKVYSSTLEGSNARPKPAVRGDPIIKITLLNRYPLALPPDPILHANCGQGTAATDITNDGTARSPCSTVRYHLLLYTDIPS